ILRPYGQQFYAVHPGGIMPDRQFDTMNHDSTETNEIAVSIGEIPEDAQVTVIDTGWSEEEKDRMKAFGYDGLDMVIKPTRT
ncbi:hypothetical protein LJC59_05540, partial [Desulfovibrio sp. OttesenSCG-928-A18]|nr:hypothetical protein [Desulfovibrio sp. OttesenSCG-928-A18]